MAIKSKKSSTPSGDTPAFSSSEATDRSTAFAKYVSFGRKLTQELGLEPGTDTLSRWLAHYLVERITEAEGASGADRRRLQDDCCRLILELWRHRADYQHNRPLKSFEPIFEMLAALRDSDKPWYVPHPRSKKEPPGEIDRWLDFARGLDYSARMLIRWCLATASAVATAEERIWLDDSFPEEVRESHEVKLATILAGESDFLADLGLAKKPAAEKKKRLEDMRNRLDAFASLSTALRNELDKALTQSDTDSLQLKKNTQVKDASRKAAKRPQNPKTRRKT